MGEHVQWMVSLSVNTSLYFNLLKLNIPGKCYISANKDKVSSRKYWHTAPAPV